MTGEADRARIRAVDARDQTRQRRLAAPRFADETDGLALGDTRDRHRPPRARPAAARRSRPLGIGKCLTRPLDLENWLYGCCCDGSCGVTCGRCHCRHAARASSECAAASADRSRRFGKPCPACVTQQRAWRPSRHGQQTPDVRRTSRSGTDSARRIGNPLGQFKGSGGVPSIVMSRLSPAVFWSRRGAALSSAHVYGCADRQVALRSIPPLPLRPHT